jgi:hypothetical protein
LPLKGRPEAGLFYYGKRPEAGAADHKKLREALLIAINALY